MVARSSLPLNDTHAVGDASPSTVHVDHHNLLAGFINASQTNPNRLKGRTFDPRQASGTQFSPTGGVIYLNKIEVPYASTVVTNLETIVTTAGVNGAASLANCYLGLYASSGNRLGLSADQSTAFQTAGPIVAAIAGGAVTVAGGPGVYVYVALLIGTQATTAAQFAQASGLGSAGVLNWDQSQPPYLAATSGTGQTALPSPISSLVAGSKLLLAGIS